MCNTDKTQLKPEGEEARHVRRTADWTRALTILTGGLVLVGAAQIGSSYLQWQAMRDQVAEMRGSSADTRRLVLASINQADALMKLEHAGEHQADATASLAESGRDQLKAIQASSVAALKQAESVQAQAKAAASQASAVTAQAGAVKSSNEIASKALASSDRPWMTLEAAGLGALQPGQKFAVSSLFQDTGRGPALLLQNRSVLMLITKAQAEGKAKFQIELPACGTACPQSTAFPGKGWSLQTELPSETLTQKVVDQIKAKELFIVTLSRADYIDAYSGKHETVSCNWYLVDKAGFTPCMFGNRAT